MRFLTTLLKAWRADVKATMPTANIEKGPAPEKKTTNKKTA